MFSDAKRKLTCSKMKRCFFPSDTENFNQFKFITVNMIRSGEDQR